MFFKKKCLICEKKFARDKLYKLKTQCADGAIAVYFCSECIKDSVLSEEQFDDYQQHLRHSE